MRDNPTTPLVHQPENNQKAARCVVESGSFLQLAPRWLLCNGAKGAESGFARNAASLSESGFARLESGFARTAAALSLLGLSESHSVTPCVYVDYNY